MTGMLVVLNGNGYWMLFSTHVLFCIHVQNFKCSLKYLKRHNECNFLYLFILNNYTISDLGTHHFRGKDYAYEVLHSSVHINDCKDN